MNQQDAAQLYYRAFREHTDFSEVPLSEEVTFRGPTGEIEGATPLRTVLGGLAQRVTGLDMRHQVAQAGQVLSFYDFDLGAPGGPIPMAERLSIVEGEIAEIELLFDPQQLAG